MRIRGEQSGGLVSRDMCMRGNKGYVAVCYVSPRAAETVRTLICDEKGSSKSCGPNVGSIQPKRVPGARRATGRGRPTRTCDLADPDHGSGDCADSLNGTVAAEVTP
eukprot:6688079-Prymnesium_polylepis.1